MTKVDRTSMAHSLEVRPPLLDHRLVEFMLSVDPLVLVDQQRRRGKLLVRQLMEPRLPQGHLNQPKSGFGLPVHRWLRAAPAGAARSGAAPDGSRCIAARRSERISPRLVPFGFGSLVHRLWLNQIARREFCSFPVSGVYGMGEYARSLAIARAASRRWPGAAIHFILSRDAPYAADAPFPDDPAALVADVSFRGGHRVAREVGGPTS